MYSFICVTGGTAAHLPIKLYYTSEGKSTLLRTFCSKMLCHDEK